MAAQLDRDHLCRDQWGNRIKWDDLDNMTLDHVQQGYGRMGVRAPSDPGHMVTMCHHGNLDWGPRHRDEERDWLARKPVDDVLLSPGRCHDCHAPVEYTADGWCERRTYPGDPKGGRLVVHRCTAPGQRARAAALPGSV